jgi:hypothetical protein
MLFFLSMMARSSSAVNFTILTSFEDRTTNIYFPAVQRSRKKVRIQLKHEQKTKPESLKVKE